MRLIDADEAIKRIIDIIEKDNDPLLLASEVEQFLKSIPTIEERKHGHWELIQHLRPYYICSECGSKALYVLDECGDAETPYCPWCGAKMDEEVKA